MCVKIYELEDWILFIYTHLSTECYHIFCVRLTFVANPKHPIVVEWSVYVNKPLFSLQALRLDSVIIQRKSQKLTKITLFRHLFWYGTEIYVTEVLLILLLLNIMLWLPHIIYYITHKTAQHSLFFQFFLTIHNIYASLQI